MKQLLQPSPKQIILFDAAYEEAPCRKKSTKEKQERFTQIFYSGTN